MLESRHLWWLGWRLYHFASTHHPFVTSMLGGFVGSHMATGQMRLKRQDAYQKQQEAAGEEEASCSDS